MKFFFLVAFFLFVSLVTVFYLFADFFLLMLRYTCITCILRIVMLISLTCIACNLGDTFVFTMLLIHIHCHKR